MIGELDNFGQLVEWHAFTELEPPADDQANYVGAQIVQTLWNIHRDVKQHPRGFPLSDFVLPFGDEQPPKPPEPVKQTLEYQERIIDTWIFTSNALLRRKGITE